MKLNPEIEQYRLTSGPYRTAKGDLHGAFNRKVKNIDMFIMSSGHHDENWEHVSVSLKNRNPNWDEMCWVKDMFWSDDTTVLQFHPMKAKYVNNHPYCLHLWKPRETEIELPPQWMV